VEKTLTIGKNMKNGPGERDHDRDPDFATVEEALQEFREGGILLVIDDEDRENEGDMILAADKVTPEAINFLATHARGLICVPMMIDRLRELDLGPMVGTNTARMQTGFTVSVDYMPGTTTGISASDRCATVRALIDPATPPADLARPGHVFPLMAQEEGVIRRPGHTEAAVDLARLAGLTPAGVLCEVLSENGEMARGAELKTIARRFGLKMLTIHDLIEYRLRTERLVTRELETSLPTEFGEFQLHLYRDDVTKEHHVALTLGNVGDGKPVLARVHSQCLTGDVFGSQRCDCGTQVQAALEIIQKEGRGALVYMRQEGRGIGLLNKLRAYCLQDAGLDTVEANVELGFRPDERDYGVGAQILADLGARQLRLMTNNPAKRVGLSAFGLEIVERVPLEAEPSDQNRRYLTTKRDKLGHLLNLGVGEMASRSDGAEGE
jgi:3,4-dihydroxy 2-butanone 4-phosphate synthase/GTP cyclohydrolase II